MSTIKFPAIWQWDLGYWKTGEWQVVEERLNEAQYNPGPGLLFAALGAVCPGTCRVAILGQDPYPELRHCTGLAFSVPPNCQPIPPSLVNIFKEYEDDLNYPAPKNGDLSKWCEQGVLLWNVFPSCAKGKPGSHHWEEWEPLTREIVEKLDDNDGMVYVFLGKSAGLFARYVRRGSIISTSHPSPLGAKRGFLGSRIFSSVNAVLKEPIDWRL